MIFENITIKASEVIIPDEDMTKFVEGVFINCHFEGVFTAFNFARSEFRSDCSFDAGCLFQDSDFSYAEKLPPAQYLLHCNTTGAKP